MGVRGGATRWMWGAALSLAVACGGAPAPRETGTLRVIATPDNARVYVDDRFVGTGRRLAVEPARLSVRTHFVTITAPGFFPHDLELDLPRGETKIEISLRPLPP